MPKYKLGSGTHESGGRIYQTGDVFETDQYLEQHNTPNCVPVKFKRVSDATKVTERPVSYNYNKYAPTSS